MAAPRILVVDDDPQIVTPTLEAAGYRTLAISDPREAWTLAARTRPDLAILGIKTAAPEGFDVALRIALSLETTKIPCIFLTARKAGLQADQARAFGAVACLEKPFKTEALLALVRELLSRGKEAR